MGHERDEKLVAMLAVVEAAKRWRNLASIDAEIQLAQAVDRLREMERQEAVSSGA